MKTKQLVLLISLLLTLIIGIFTGATIQRTHGVGNLLRGAGIAYPTRTPVPVPAAPAEIDIPPIFQGELSLFILAGQSNMVGWAPLPEHQEIDARIFVFGNDYRWRVAEEPVDDPAGQVDIVSEDTSAGFGPSLAFASSLRSRQPDLVVGLIPCAKSSSAIIEWQRDLSDQSLYGSCLKRAQAASTMGQVAGVLFFQGETDAIDVNRYPQFQPKPTEWSVLFSSFVNDFREDLQEPDLPIVFAQIGANTNPTDVPYWDLVKELQSSTDLPHSAMIQTDDLPLLDGLHFTAESYRIIGERFAAAYLNLVEKE
jgi:hypothetical protein